MAAGVEYRYPSGLYALEFLFYIFYALLSWAALFIGTRGNKMAKLAPIAGFVLLCSGLALCNIYFLLWQVYVVRADLVVNGISLLLIILELVFTAVVAIRATRVRTA
eukprot:m51a1_g8337 hypothetical protein (107) ;mRNA; r:178274-178832